VLVVVPVLELELALVVVLVLVRHKLPGLTPDKGQSIVEIISSFSFSSS